MSNIDQILKDRGSRYGEFCEHAFITQGIKAAMATGRNWDGIDDDMRECLEMVAHKIGRILNGDPDYIDSWTDIIGYTRLVEKRLIDEQGTAKVFAFTGAKPTQDAQDSKAEADAVCNCPGCQLGRIIESLRKAA